ncbi:hypothetical protein BU23DRAFT_645212 [Bimuria novae-zelandiae CBS 107.79]|uniref:Uncharacterized protein n=1 Tax=Bimuria novae-zelandiae CBS 107.79 TaxID=1447943 RepID=A0A6A5V518_9PLEO|nr:hypothetical protein BU23DRAFT_645212 [Bimuria novae-zelandiae CBS 107.79]
MLHRNLLVSLLLCLLATLVTSRALIIPFALCKNHHSDGCFHENGTLFENRTKILPAANVGVNSVFSSLLANLDRRAGGGGGKGKGKDKGKSPEGTPGETGQNSETTEGGLGEGQPSTSGNKEQEESQQGQKQNQGDSKPQKQGSSQSQQQGSSQPQEQPMFDPNQPLGINWNYIVGDRNGQPVSLNDPLLQNEIRMNGCKPATFAPTVPGARIPNFFFFSGLEGPNPTAITPVASYKTRKWYVNLEEAELNFDKLEETGELEKIVDQLMPSIGSAMVHSPKTSANTNYFWGLQSKAYARAVSGTAFVAIPKNRPLNQPYEDRNRGSFLWSMEIPELTRNPKVDEIHLLEVNPLNGREDYDWTDFSDYKVIWRREHYDDNGNVIGGPDPPIGTPADTLSYSTTSVPIESPVLISRSCGCILLMFIMTDRSRLSRTAG